MGVASKEYKDFIQYKLNEIGDNITTEAIDLFLGNAAFCLEEFGDMEYSLELTCIAKKMCAKLILDRDEYDVSEMMRFHDFCAMKKINVEEMSHYWKILLWEAQHKVLDSYLLYIEKNRLAKDRFYAPKRTVFMKIGVIQALQDLIDDKLDTLSISLPPGTGKCQPLYSKVLTPDGFVNMGDIKVGDKVISATRNISTVLGVYPQGKKKVYEITLENGLKVRSSDDHLWYCRYNYFANKFKDKTIELKEIMANHYKYLLPVLGDNDIFYLRIGAIEYIGEEECQCIYISDESHLYITDNYIITHNTTLEKFFHSAVMGWFPEEGNLFFSHSSDITRMYYDGVLAIVTDEAEYTWGEIFPNSKVTNTNAKMGQITIDKYKPFPNLQTGSVSSEMAGKVRASKFLFVDDMIGKIEEALNKSILDKLWNIYTSDLLQRKTVDENEKPCKELMIATRWSVHDIIGRLKRDLEGDKRARFIAIPDIDPETGESNFMFESKGFSTEFFHKQEKFMDEITYRCLYKNDPIEREGLLYKEDKIRRYASLPTQEPDAVLAICDTKTTGIDYMFLPVFAQYGNDYYMIDCICDDSTDFDVQIARITDILMRNKVQKCEFESNAGGSRLAYDVENNLKEKGYTFCNITTKATETNKETRIIMNAEWIIRQCLFKFKEDYDPKSDYGKAMNFMLTYSVAGKNKFDDVVDGLANFRLFVESMTVVTGVAKAAFNPFRSYRGW